MNVTLSENRRAWQLEAREFARDVVAPASLKRDRLPGGHFGAMGVMREQDSLAVALKWQRFI